MSYDDIRLETNGSVIMYFAPNFEVTPVMKNNLFTADRPRGQGTVSRDQQMYRYEITIQGEFMDSSELPQAQVDAVVNNIGLDPDFGPRDQVNHLVDTFWNVGGPFELYDGPDEYTAYEVDNADYGNGVYPTVQIDEFRPTRESGMPRFSYTLKMVVGEDPTEGGN